MSGPTLRVGVTAMLTDRGVAPGELGLAVEELGFDGLYVPEHTHMPVARVREHPIADQLPEAYRRTLDPFVALSMVAAVTSRIRLGTGILLLAQRDPIVTAKAVATLDHLSGGRFTLGLGYGWNREELAHHGVAWGDRREVIEERLALMQALWSPGVANFAGSHHQLDDSQAWPKPVQGRVPVWLGVTRGPRNLADVARIADAWMPHGSSGLDVGMTELRTACEALGRDPGEVATVPFGVLPTPAKVERLQGLGVSEFVVLLPDDDRDEALRQLEQHAAVLDDAVGAASWRHG